MGVTKSPAETRIALPGQAAARPLARVVGRADRVLEHVPGSTPRARASRSSSAASSAGWNDVTWTLPSDTKFPIQIAQFQVIETNTARQRDGAIVLDRIEIDSAPDVELPAEEPLRADPLISPSGRTNGEEDWTFATLSDIQFTAADPTLAKVGIAALKRIRRAAARPRRAQRRHHRPRRAGGPRPRARDARGRRLRPHPGRPGAARGSHPGAERRQGAVLLRAGQPRGVLGERPGHARRLEGRVRRGVPHVRPQGHAVRPAQQRARLAARLRLRRSSGCSSRRWRPRRDDGTIDNVLVFAHHPVDDPAETKASQLTDRDGGPARSRSCSRTSATASGKGVTMTGSHAQIAERAARGGRARTRCCRRRASRRTGRPTAAASPAGSSWSVDADASADRPVGDGRRASRSRRRSSSTSPAAVEVGTLGHAQRLDRPAVRRQPERDAPRAARVPDVGPLGRVGLARDRRRRGGAADAARRAGKVAILDPVTRAITGPADRAA